MSRKRVKHNCADHLYDIRKLGAGDSIFCECKRIWTLTHRGSITFRQMVTSWVRPMAGSVVSDRLAWIRNRAAERAHRREQTLRRREWLRG